MMKTIPTSLNHNSSTHNKSLAEILSLRFQYEQIVSYRRSFDLPNYNSDIDTLQDFIESGAKNNRFRKRFTEAVLIAQEIIESYNYETTDLSSVHRQKEQAV